MLLAFPTIAGLLGFGVWMLVGAASTRTAGGSAVLAVLGSIALVPALFFVVLALRVRHESREVTTDSIRFRAGFLRRTERVIPLMEVASAGMVFEILHRPNGWFSYVWLADGQPVSLPLGVCMGRRKDDWDKLAATDQGVLLIEVLNRARRLQGASGPIASDRETNRRGFGQARAYWPANRALVPSAE
jgi:hypothetical protein